MKNDKHTEEDGLGNRANTGNASNPKPGKFEQDDANQYLPKEAEKYIREAGNIEDLPDSTDQENMEEKIQKQAGS